MALEINKTAKEVYDWVESFGWHNKTPLECLALIGSEVGEAVNECRDARPTYKLGTELADICTRTFDFSVEQGVDLESCIAAKEVYGLVGAYDCHNMTPLQSLALIARDLGSAINECLGENPTEGLGPILAGMCLRVFSLANQYGIDLEACIAAKMEINRARKKKPAGRVK